MIGALDTSLPFPTDYYRRNGSGAGQDGSGHMAEDTGDCQDFMQVVRNYMDDIYQKLLCGDTEPSYQIGGCSFTLKEWDRLMEEFDALEETLSEEKEKDSESSIDSLDDLRRWRDIRFAFGDMVIYKKADNICNLIANLQRETDGSTKAPEVQGEKLHAYQLDGRLTSGVIGLSGFGVYGSGQSQSFYAVYADDSTAENPIVEIHMEAEDGTIQVFCVNINEIDPKRATQMEMFALCCHRDAQGQSVPNGGESSYQTLLKRASFIGYSAESLEDFQNVYRDWEELLKIRNVSNAGLLMAEKTYCTYPSSDSDKDEVRYITLYTADGICCRREGESGYLWEIDFEEEGQYEKVMAFLNSLDYKENLRFACHENFWRDFLADQIDLEEFCHFLDTRVVDGVPNYIDTTEYGQNINKEAAKYAIYMNPLDFINILSEEDLVGFLKEGAKFEDHEGPFFAHFVEDYYRWHPDEIGKRNQRNHIYRGVAYTLAELVEVWEKEFSQMVHGQKGKQKK